MKETAVRILHEEKVKARINTLRDVLNELCCTIDEPEMNMERLIVSHKLDELIVEYMLLKKNIHLKKDSKHHPSTCRYDVYYL